MKRILCYGDSNTWGYIPGIGARYPSNVRWTGVLASALGGEYAIIEDGINGRTTVFDDYVADYRNGKKGLGYSICSNSPIDMIVLSLGTNDLKYIDAVGSSRGLEELLRLIANSNAFFPVSDGFENEQIKVLVVSPIRLHKNVEKRTFSKLRDKAEESQNFAQYYKLISEKYGAHFMDASEYAQPSLTDGIHMDPESHRKLGLAIADKIISIYGKK